MAREGRGRLHDQNHFQQLELWVAHSSSYWWLLTLLSMFSSAVKQLASVPLITSPWKKLYFNIHRFVILCFDCLHNQTSKGKYSTLLGQIQHTFGANTAHLGQIQHTLGASTAHLHTVWKILHTFSLWSYMASYNNQLQGHKPHSLHAGYMLTTLMILHLHSWIKLGLCLSEWDQIWNVDSL